jgi:hypothetical protein
VVNLVICPNVMEPAKKRRKSRKRKKNDLTDNNLIKK